MAQQTLYTEEQVRRAIAMGYDLCHVKHIPSDDMIDSFIESLNPIKLPTDKEIRDCAKKAFVGLTQNRTNDWINGARWMKDKTLNK